MNTPSHLYRFTKFKNEIMVKVAEPYKISDNKFAFSDNYKIKKKKIIEIETEGKIIKKTCHYNKDYHSSTYLSFASHDINTESQIAIPLYSKCKFTCASCNRIFIDQKQSKCCSMRGLIIIEEAQINKIYIPKLNEINDVLSLVKDEFIELHFPDLLDSIMMK
jgi:hypothetical protein